MGENVSESFTGFVILKTGEKIPGDFNIEFSGRFVRAKNRVLIIPFESIKVMEEDYGDDNDE